MSRLSSKPYTSSLLNVLLRSELSDVEKPDISTIGVVGALFDKDYNLFRDDEVTIKRTVAVLKRAGITVANIPSFQFYNLLPPIKNDFFQATLPGSDAAQADLLIVCAVCNIQADYLTIDKMHPLQRGRAYENFGEAYHDLYKGYNFNREVSISPYYKVPNAWATGAHNAGAKIVVTRGGEHDEIHSGDFLRGDYYVAAMPTSERFERISATVSGSLGVVVHRDAVAGFKTTADAQDLLGQRILAL